MLTKQNIHWMKNQCFPNAQAKDVKIKVIDITKDEGIICKIIYKSEIDYCTIT